MKTTYVFILLLILAGMTSKFPDAGLATFPVHGINSPSDCPAWSAHPMHAILTNICGIEPSSPGFKTTEVKPAPGNFSEFTSIMPLPLGRISIAYKNSNQEIFSIHFPKRLTGTFNY